MKQKRFSVKNVLAVFGVLFFIMIMGAYLTNEKKDILYIRHNLDKFHTETVPYHDEIEFTLKTDEVIHGIDKPIKITSIYDTDVYVTEVREKKNHIYVVLGFDSHINWQGGTMLSFFRLNDDDYYTFSTGFIEFDAYDEYGEIGDYGGGFGDNRGQYQQVGHYNFDKEEFLKSNEWTFEISGFHLLNYSEK
ncbi:hypothetical protein [Bacillus solimangrovi]|uniref:Uncharacterized protein n=1 Tax=Bacillus solimangrovi TaxID=1305675 RepID=A0A1E5LEQ2_9BACI|nr:hypothetical protein [Bacillus solimangrovi]OEH92532.1 hypothetical protein BFG57_15465 [Bacillus solimangrovi]